MEAWMNDVPAAIVAAKAALRDRMTDRRDRMAALDAWLEKEVAAVRAEQAAGGAVPVLAFADIAAGRVREEDRARIRRRGCAIVRGVMPREQADGWNAEIGRYIDDNDYYERAKSKVGMDQYFALLDSAKPQIFGLYWSRPQVQARQHESLAATRAFLNRLWTFDGPDGPVFDPDRECTYADRVRRRQPGDKTIGLSPHADGGSVERWCDPSFHAVYRELLSGDPLAYDPWIAAGRTETKEIPSPAVCSLFRTFQGWTALTRQGPGDGTLRLAPIAGAMGWMILRALQDDVGGDDLCGAKPGRALAAFPQWHAKLLEAVVPIPVVEPGDTVWWHPDVIHAVEDEHRGSGYSNVIYIGAAPDCAKNRAFLPRQAKAFLEGRSCPDFAAEDYEVDFVGRAVESDLTPLGRRQMGLDY